MIRMLGIESSCDETAAAIVEETGVVPRPWYQRSSVVASQVKLHKEWGGVVPELASRQHLRDICGVVDRAMDDAGISWGGLHGIAVTQGPGLVGSLLVGLAVAKGMAAARGLPLIGVHHLVGHIESLVLHNGEIPLPAVILVVSGGHTNLFRVPKRGQYELLGRTRDDAAGEAYDKVAKLLGLGYPGGPIVDRLAQTGNDRAIDFPVTRFTHADRNAGPALALPAGFEKALAGRTEFSFSGLKTSVLRYVKQQRAAHGLDPNGSVNPFSDAQIADICASFQRVVVTTLLDRTFDAANFLDAHSIGIAGGVAANSRLRHEGLARAERLGLPLFLPNVHLSTDNAAMIAAAGLRRFRAGHRDTLALNADPSLPLPGSAV